MGSRTKIVIYTDKLDTEKRVKKAIRVGTQMDIILNSDMFKELILTMPEKYRLGETGKYKNATNEEIYNVLMAGDEEWQNKGKDFTWELHIHDYSRWYSKVVGHITPFKRPIWVNTKFFDYMDDENVGSNFSHEGGHHLGFRHSGKYLRFSFSYYVNIAYESCYQFLIEGKEEDVTPEPEKFRLVCTWKGWRILIFRKTCRRVYDI